MGRERRRWEKENSGKKENCSAPVTWNSLPRTATDNDSLGTFLKSRLKTFLFSLTFN